MSFKLLHPADQIAMIMERIYSYGMTTTSGGNLSILDNENNMWITPSGVDKGSLTSRDIVCIKKDGTIIGKHKPSSEFQFHDLIYKKRPDIKALLHAHSPSLITFSIVRKIPDTNLVPNVKLICGNVGIAKYGLPGSKDLGEKIAAVFGRGINAVILENHGIVVGALNLFKAFMAFETLEFCARLEINANRIGKPAPLMQKDIESLKNKQHSYMEDYVPEEFSFIEKAARKEMSHLIQRAYNQKLFTSTQGTFSQRLDNESFIITPYGDDRRYIDTNDIVKIKRGLKEKGKIPSRSVLLHKYIYEKHLHVESIIISRPPNIMAFAVTGENFNPKVIPESYILLREIPKIPFGSRFMHQKMVARIFKKNIPAVIVKNDCVIVTGNSLLNAFDILEVAEFTAKAIIDSRSIGNIINISNDKIAKLDKAYNLEIL
jgi:L-fuculose-phosphate aldolase